MGIYLNPGNKGFRESIQSAIYVDKTELIDKLNAVLDTRQKYVCISRPRRFGKSMAADMLAAYYDRETDSRKLFEKYKTDYQIEAVLEGRFEKFAIDKLKIASFDEKLSVRETEKLVKNLVSPAKKVKTERNTAEDAIYESLEEKMKGIMGTKVSIQRKKNNKGKIEIEYYSRDELERIIDLFESIR